MSWVEIVLALLLAMFGLAAAAMLCGILALGDDFEDEDVWR